MSSYIAEIHLHNNGGPKARNGIGYSTKYVHNPAAPKKKCKLYAVEVVYDPIKFNDGGLRTGALFQTEDWIYTLRSKSISDGAIVRVLPDQKSNGKDRKWEPGIYRCVTLRVELPEGSPFVAPNGGRAYMEMIKLETQAEIGEALNKARKRVKVEL